ncbi:MAG: LysR substrate-binding domain-containing protein [Burkholderiaceae bacterium]
MLAELRVMTEGLNAWQAGASGEVLVGTLLAASKLVAEAITRLRKAVPHVTVEVRVGTNVGLFPALERGDIDVVVGYLPRTGERALDRCDSVRLAHHPLHDEALCVVVNRRHPLGGCRKLSAGELEGADWVLPSRDSVAYGAAIRFLERIGVVPPRHAVYSVSVLTTLALVREQPMLAMMPRSPAEMLVRAGLISILPLKIQDIIGAVGYTLRADRPQPPAVRRFLDALHECSRAHGEQSPSGASAVDRA